MRIGYGTERALALSNGTLKAKVEYARAVPDQLHCPALISKIRIAFFTANIVFSPC